MCLHDHTHAIAINVNFAYQALQIVVRPGNKARLDAWWMVMLVTAGVVLKVFSIKLASYPTTK
jgi:hypothetical protein